MKFTIKLLQTIAFSSLLLCPLTSFGQGRSDRPAFNAAKDILIAQFDSRPDADDVHSQAALGCLLAHSDFAGVNAYAVSHAWGIQGGHIWDSDELLTEIFGPKGAQNWTDAEEGWQQSVDRVVAKVTPILKAGGRVWVQEAGQSDFSRDWVQKLITQDNGISAATTRERVTIVQHSTWNEDHTSEDDLEYVKLNTDYARIDDGNVIGNDTPQYKGRRKSRLAAVSEDNLNTKARKYWNMADSVVLGVRLPQWTNRDVKNGHLDYSDCVENWWIFELGDRASTHDKFWERYVINDPNDNDVTPIKITTPGGDDQPDAFVGSTYKYQINATGGILPYTWSVVSSSLPSGLTFNTANHSIEGVIRGEQSGTVTIQVTGATGQTDQKTYTVNPQEPADTNDKVFQEQNGLIVIEAESVPLARYWAEKKDIPGYNGESYYEATKNFFHTPGQGILNYPMKIKNGGSYMFLMRSYIATGDNSTESNDVFSRVVDEFGNTVRPNNFHELSPTQDWYKNFTQTLNSWSWTTNNGDGENNHPKWTLEAGKKYILQLSARSNGHAIDRFVMWNTAKVFGHRFVGARGFIRGAAKPVLEALQVSEYVDDDGDIVDTDPVITSNGLNTAIANKAFSQKLMSKDGEGTISWIVTSGALPAGLSLSVDGLISGTPTVLGTSTFTVTAVDINGDIDSKELSLSVIIGYAYKEADGLIVMDMEAAKIKNGWVEKTAIPNFDGTSYYEATNESDTPNANNAIEFPITLTTHGRYQIQLRSFGIPPRDGAEPADSFVRVVDQDGNTVTPKNSRKLKATEGWHNVYISEFNKWSWNTHNNPAVLKGPYWELSSDKVYTLQISAKAKGHAIDTIVLYKRNQVEQKYSNHRGYAYHELIEGLGASDIIEVPGEENTISSIYLPDSLKK